MESIIFRAATSPEARRLIKQAALKEPLYAAAQLAWAVLALKTPASAMKMVEDDFRGAAAHLYIALA